MASGGRCNGTRRREAASCLFAHGDSLLAARAVGRGHLQGVMRALALPPTGRKNVPVEELFQILQHGSRGLHRTDHPEPRNRFRVFMRHDLPALFLPVIQGTALIHIITKPAPNVYSHAVIIRGRYYGY